MLPSLKNKLPPHCLSAVLAGGWPGLHVCLRASGLLSPSPFPLSGFLPARKELTLPRHPPHSRSSLPPSLRCRRLLAQVPEPRQVQVEGAEGVRLRLPGVPSHWLFSDSPGACGQSPRPRRRPCALAPPRAADLAHVSVRSQLGLQEGFGQQSRGQHRR